MRRPARRLIRAKTVSSGAMVAVHILVHCPVFGVGRFHGVCHSAYVKSSRLCDTASRARTV